MTQPSSRTEEIKPNRTICDLAVGVKSAGGRPGVMTLKYKFSQQGARALGRSGAFEMWHFPATAEMPILAGACIPQPTVGWR
ncbi:ribose ABC transporter permease [Anopheles sinensis]|uniref:Ribose ABC transporter permease n=1 Tax=Anopheles sinensis TaxID=74873 RepID=A0A084WRG0_ANOSI|nr:ribose ABC transporter permease [Anopheles sinensis]